MPPQPLLEVRDLSVRYQHRQGTIKALDDVSFDVLPGETVGVVGESGSGKSTAANAILGLTPVDSGSVRFAGEDITHLSFKERRALYRRMQIVFQNPYGSLNPSRTIGGILAEPLQSYGERDRGTIRARVSELLERVHLPPEAADRYPSQFSGGQRQRIAIARALMLSPELVICDEAVSALDLSVQAQILNLLRELQAASGLSYLFISHDLEVVRHMCDRLVVLYKGRIMESGRTARVADAPAHPYTRALHAAAPLPNPRLQRRRHLTAEGAVATLPEDEAEGWIPVGCPFAPRCPYAESRCRNERPELRSAGTDGLVACHRYPEWQARAMAANGGLVPGDCLTTNGRAPAPGRAFPPSMGDQ